MSDGRSLPFKDLTPGNWQAPDPTSGQFARLSPVAGIQRMDGDDWARHLLAVELAQHVPDEIHELFAVARGTMLYGWFFYPLYVVGEGQLHRTTEAAVKACYRRVDGPKAAPTFNEAIDWLIERGVIPVEDRERWHAVRRLRNAASHPNRHAAMPPGHVLRVLQATAHDLNRLFARAAALVPDA